MNVIVPVKITDSVLVSSSVPEPAPGDGTAWSATTEYQVDAVVYLNHRRFQAAAKNTGRNPVTDVIQPPVWVDIGPTNKWAAFDDVVSTQTTAEDELTLVLRPGFFSAMALFGLAGYRLQGTVREFSGGPVIYTYDAELNDRPPTDWWEYWFERPRPQTSWVAFGIEPYAQAEVTIRITAAGRVAVGAVAVGHLRALGRTQYGAKSKMVDYSRIRTDSFGNTTIVRGRSARDIQATAFIDIADAPAVEDQLDDLRGVPAVWIATDQANFRGLRTFGLGSGEISYDHPTLALMTINVKGLI